ncbi:hypothetical protein L6164_007689 [Bauhinia variegata]|uniref:Uncharacterized protein n=1 Tax=Bauhinia variegata TaxID=167791 RepID=A0ACB9PEP0_BAUVA|nr:hypothetical protein L6164_007689 [Bauhinia variegata]
MLRNILDFELSAQDVGHALQFLEFCSVFRRVLDIKEGEPEALLQELALEQNTHYEKIIEFHKKMLRFMCNDSLYESLRLHTTEGVNSWLKSMWNSISEPILDSKELQLDVLCKNNNLYQNLEFSKKLRILNFICDECLNKQKIRDNIHEEYMTFNGRGKEAKIELSAVKKMKHLKHETIVRETNGPASILRNKGVISDKDRLKQAEADMIVAKGKVPKGKQGPETIRIDPIFIDSSGKRFWKLKCFSGEESVLSQDVKYSSDEANFDERWFMYDADQRQLIEDYISSR